MVVFGQRLQRAGQRHNCDEMRRSAGPARTKKWMTDRFLRQGGVLDRGRGGASTLPASGWRH